MSTPELSIVQVRAAAGRIRPLIQRTPVHTSETLDRLAGRHIFFKCELFQKTGAFKYRGATNAVQLLDHDTARRGVVTHSSGNHGQALALAARVRGIPATVVMPTTAAAVMKAAVRGYGAEIVESGPSLDEREAKIAEVRAKTGAVFIPPFDDAAVIAGQGTSALELLEEQPQLDAVVAPIGGGGLMSGFCLAARGVSSKCRVFGAEPLGADDASRSKIAGEIVKLEHTRSIADGLLANNLGQLTWPIIRDQVDRIFTVNEEQIIAAMRLVWERMKLLIEPSAAVAVAAVLCEEFRSLSGLANVGVVLSGGNVNLDKLYW